MLAAVAWERVYMLPEKGASGENCHTLAKDPTTS